MGLHDHPAPPARRSHRVDTAEALDAAARLLRAFERSHRRALLHQRAGAIAQQQAGALIDELGRLLGEADPQRGPRRAPAPLAQHHDDVPCGTASGTIEGAVDGMAVATTERNAAAAGAAPSMEVYLLGPFRVFANDRPIDEWPNSKGKAVFKYLVTHRAQPVPREVLMAQFWPGADAEAARNNLNVAIYGLRKALEAADADFAFVLFRQGCYAFNPALRLWVDAESFTDHLHQAVCAEAYGDAVRAAAEYRVAKAIHHGALLVDDRYEDWLIPLRQGLQNDFQHVLAQLAHHDFDRQHYESCAATCTRMLEVDRCDEAAHRMLMRCYERMGQTHLALRQYHFCVDALARELDLIPSPQTVALFQQVRRRQSV